MPCTGPAAPTSGSDNASTADIVVNRPSPSDHANGRPSATWSNAATHPIAVDAANALENAASSTTLRCTSASANNALTVTHNSTCTATAAAPMPTSAGPTRRATMNTDANESTAATAASKPDQNTSTAWLCFSGGERTAAGTDCR